MSRTRGARDADYDLKRTALVARVRDGLVRREVGHPSFRELAAAAGVGQTTLRHYFGDMDGLVSAVFQESAREGARYLARIAEPSGPFTRSIEDAVAFMAAGQRQGALRAVHAAGQSEGMRRPAAGGAYRKHILDATLEAVTKRLERHREKEEMHEGVNCRAAAIVLVAPVIFAFQHQADLGGAAEAAIDLDTFLSQHAAAFVRGHRR